MKVRKSVLGLGAAGVGLILLGAALWALVSDALARPAGRPTDFSAVPTAVDFAAPRISLKNLNGGRSALSDYLGHVVLVNLWATWCPPCIAEMPVFQRYYEKYRDRDFTVIAINDGESGPDVAEFVQAHGLTFEIWLDPTYEASERAFKAANLPTSYVIDRDGRVRLMWIGAVNEGKLKRFVTPLILD